MKQEEVKKSMVAFIKGIGRFLTGLSTFLILWLGSISIGLALGGEPGTIIAMIFGFFVGAVPCLAIWFNSWEIWR